MQRYNCKISKLSLRDFLTVFCICIIFSNRIYANIEETPIDLIKTAIIKNDSAKITEILQLPDFDVNIQNKHGFTALMLAAMHNKLDLIKELADLFPEIDVNMQGEGGKSALHYAVLSKNPQIIKELIALFPNIDVNMRDDQDFTPLHTAVGTNSAVIHELANMASCDVNAQNKIGDTALIIATKYERIAEIIELAKIPNINPKLENNNGDTAIYIAQTELTRQCLIKFFPCFKKYRLLITGGAGYIGSHACIEFLKYNCEIVVIDNLANSSEEALTRVKQITNKDLHFVYGDIRDAKLLDEIFRCYNFDMVIHFAGLKSVGESVKSPLEYFDNNVFGTIQLLTIMKKHGVKKIVFSSSATVYGVPDALPITENFPRHATNPYGRSKLMIEEMLEDLYVADNSWSIALLRYFNPIGAHKSGLIGEDPRDIPNNLMPYISKVAAGKLKMLSVFGDDYPTIDGTGVRDYIHVVDLAKAHVKAFIKLQQDYTGVHYWNLGIGRGYSVLEIVREFEKNTNQKVPYQITARRAGDVASCYSDPSKAKADLGWVAAKTLKDMIIDTWRWQSKNPDGYR